MSNDAAPNSVEMRASRGAIHSSCTGGAPADSRDRLSAIWNGLVGGRTRISAEFSAHDRIGFELTDRATASEVHSLSIREREMVEYALLSDSQKAAAMDLRVSQGLVAGRLHKSFRKMGLDCTYRTIPPLLVLIVLAIRRAVEPRRLSIETMERTAGTVHAISVERPDARVGTLLSPAESAVARMVIDGRTHQQIAVVRRTSRRTVANQIAAIHEKLGASGRIDLISRLSAGTWIRDSRPARVRRRLRTRL